MQMWHERVFFRFSSFEDLDPDTIENIIFQVYDINNGSYSLYRIGDNLDHDFNTIVWSRDINPPRVYHICGPVNFDEYGEYGPERSLQYFKKLSKQYETQYENIPSNYHDNRDFELWQWRNSLLSEKMVKEVVREEAIRFAYSSGISSCDSRSLRSLSGYHRPHSCGCFDNWESTLNWMKEVVDSR